MAFDMYHDDQRAFIDHHEEGIFRFVEVGKHPQLNTIKDNFCSDPVFSSSQCNELVHELIALRISIDKDKSSKYLIAVIDRLLPFFSQAYQNGCEVRCESD